MTLPPGFQLREYRIERCLGRGGFGITYSAVHEHLDRRVAIKEYRPRDHSTRDANYRVAAATVEDEDVFKWGLARFLDEGRALEEFDHVNIVRVHDLFQELGTAYIVMEYIDGEPLSEMLERQTTLAEAEIREHVLPLTDGLAEVHTAGLLHRDIKPGNIMVRANGIPVLIDFGSARQAVNAKSRKLTAVVTDGYAPREQHYESMDEHEATDIYALGAVLYRCVTGDVPDSALERYEQDKLVPLAEAFADGVYSEGLLAAIDAALGIRDFERPYDIDEFRNVLSAPATRRVWPAIVGGRYELGLGRTPKDHDKATEWYTRAAQQGDEEAEHYLAYAEAFRHDTQAAEQGDADAQFRVGRCYQHGRYTSQDYAQAIKWYIRAAGLGHVNAQVKLGCLYKNGEGTLQDHAQAIQWYTLAAEQGSVTARCWLNVLRRAAERGDVRVRLQDPLWSHMAIERQFRSLIEPPHGLEPATLIYLREAAEGTFGTEGRYLDNAVGALDYALQADRYPSALICMLWGEEADVDWAMNQTLEDPEQLLSEAFALGIPDQ